MIVTLFSPAIFTTTFAMSAPADGMAAGGGST